MALHSLVLVIFVAFFCSSIFCSTPCPESSQTTISSSKPPDCSGFANVECPKGYICNITTTRHDDIRECVPNPEGQKCGGIEEIKCPLGYKCVVLNLLPDGEGKCYSESSPAGQFCGGFNTVQCPSGYTCRITYGVTDAVGMCVPVNSSN